MQRFRFVGSGIHFLSEVFFSQFLLDTSVNVSTSRSPLVYLRLIKLGLQTVSSNLLYVKVHHITAAKFGFIKRVPCLLISPVYD